MPHTASRLSRSAPWLAGSAIASVLFAAPVSAAPSFTRTFNGFTDAFAPGAWTKATQTAGTASLSETQMQLQVTNAVGSSSEYTFTSSNLDGTYDGDPGNESLYKFKSGTATFDWFWTFQPGDFGTQYPFETVVGSNTSLLSKFNGGDNTIRSNFDNTATGATLAVNTPDAFGFRLTGNGGIGFGSAAVVQNFSFTAEYVRVPGPLPAAAAMGGFLWSRKLRRRLKAARTTA